MSGRFPNARCPRCGDQNYRETISHRYLTCVYVAEQWEWVKFTITSLDIGIDAVNDQDLISLNFPYSLRENAILWLLGQYIEVVEKEVVLKGVKLDTNFIKCLFKQKKYLARTQAIPDLGIILGVDFDPQGIG